jgi:hypothetical protein
MQINKKLLTIIFLPSVLININNSSGNSVVRSSATSEATGENAKTETRIETNVNGNRTTVETNSSGRVEVENINGQTTIRTSKGVTPTIIITGVPTEKIKIEEIGPNEAEKEAEAPINRSGIDKLVRDIFQKLLTIFKFW